MLALVVAFGAAFVLLSLVTARLDALEAAQSEAGLDQDLGERRAGAAVQRLPTLAGDGNLCRIEVLHDDRAGRQVRIHHGADRCYLPSHMELLALTLCNPPGISVGCSLSTGTTVPGTGRLISWDADHLCVRARGIMHPLSVADARLATT